MSYSTQNALIMTKLLKYYADMEKLDTMLSIINGSSSVSLRTVDWFATNYAKKYYTIITSPCGKGRFKVYDDYKLRLRSYSKKRFDPFCRHERIMIPYKDGQHVQTTLGQLNFFWWAIENGIIDYIKDNHTKIEADMAARNSTSRRRTGGEQTQESKSKTRKRREELSILASKSVHRENVEIVVQFD